MKYKRYYLIFLILLHLSPLAKGVLQTYDKLSFHQISALDGLSSNWIRDIHKDSKGFMWFVTWEGLNRYDGREIKELGRINDGLGIDMISLTSIAEDVNGHIWVGSEGLGLYKYNPLTEKFSHYYAGNQEINLSNDYIRSLFASENGFLYVGTPLGVDMINVNTGETDFLSSVPENSNKQQNPVLCLYIDHRQLLWIGTQNGLIMYDPELNISQSFHHNPEDHTSLSSNTIQAIYEDETGNIWIGTKNSGLNLYERQAQKFSHISTTSGNNGKLSDNNILSITGNGKGVLFAGTENGGLNIVNIHTHKVILHKVNYGEEHGLKDKSIYSLYYDDEQILWLGTYNSGINFTFPKPFHFQHFKFSSQGLNNPNILSVTSDPKGNFWIGTDGGGVNIFHPEKESFSYFPDAEKDKYNLANSAVMHILHDKSNNVWMGVYGKGLFRYNTLSQSISQIYSPHDYPSSHQNDVISLFTSPDGKILFANKDDLYQVNLTDNTFSPYIKGGDTIRDFIGYCSPAWDSNGTLWIGHGSGILKINPETKNATNIDKVWNQQGDFKNRSVAKLFIDSRNNIWLAPINNGLARYRDKEGDFIQYNKEENGLRSNQISNIFEDQNGNLWMTTPLGITIFQDAVFLPSKTIFQNYEVDVNRFNRNALYRISPNEFMLGGNNGFMRIEIANDFHLNNKVPPVYITRFQISNQTIQPGTKDSPLKSSIETTKRITLKHHSNSFSFDFAALSYREPSHNKYKVYLENFEKKGQWTSVDGSQNVSYTNIPPGTYYFHVKASNNNGLWNDQEKTIEIIIDPPFYKTWWAFLIYFLFICLLVLFLYRFIKIHYQLGIERIEVQKMKELDAMKTNFVTNVSHEFRTPLTLILEPLDNVLSQKNIQKPIRDKLTLIRKNANRLKRMTNQLLDYQKILTGKDALTLQRGDLCAFAKNVTGSFKLRVEKKEQTLTLQIDEMLSDVFFDADKIEKILYNLLSNACKFTDKNGKIDVQIMLTGDHNLEILVSDNGIGISQEDQQKIFDRFFRIEQKSYQKVDGTGIGLALTKELVKLYGGEISLESQEGVGSTFMINLPLFDCEQFPQSCKDIAPEKPGNTAEEKILPQEISHPNKKTILVVEDNEDLRHYITSELNEIYQIIEATNGEEGIVLAKKHFPDLIISDIMMPVMDGVELCRKLKTSQETSHIPVLLLTAKSGMENQMTGISAGADDYITKPFSMAVLGEKIKNILQTQQSLINKYQSDIFTPEQSSILPESEKKVLSKIIEVIEENLTDPDFNISLVSEKMGMSKSSFFRKLKAITGKSPVEFLQVYKMEKALGLIQAGNHNISEIAYDTGFSYPSYFTLSFKKHFGKSPSDYIKQLNRKKTTTAKSI